jgi:hypothetical protein
VGLAKLGAMDVVVLWLRDTATLLGLGTLRTSPIFKWNELSDQLLSVFMNVRLFSREVGLFASGPVGFGMRD